MKLLSTYYSDNGEKKAEVFRVNDYTYKVVVKALEHTIQPHLLMKKLLRILQKVGYYE
jgi:uncharacterized protein (DUF1778 family)